MFCKNSNGQPGELRVKKESVPRELRVKKETLWPKEVISWIGRIRRGGLGRNIEVGWLSTFKYNKTWRMLWDDAL